MPINNIQRFPSISYDKIRYRDTDSQGHVNNAVFSSFLETGRVEILYNKSLDLLSANSSIVIASLNLIFLHELRWPGQVDIGTAITRIGNSSIKLYQELYQNSNCIATADTTIVQVDNSTGKSKALSDEAKNHLKNWLIEHE